MIDAKINWDDHLPLIESSYSNSFLSYIQMALFKVLYGRICISPIGWFEVCEAYFIGLDSVPEDMERV